MNIIINGAGDAEEGGPASCMLLTLRDLSLFVVKTISSLEKYIPLFLYKVQAYDVIGL